MIKIEKIGSKAGFKKEQIADIAGQLLEVLNKKKNIKYFEKALFQVFKKDIKEAWKDRTFRIIYELQHGDDIVIKVKNTNCKLTIYNSYESIFNILKKLNVKLTSDLKINNPFYEKINTKPVAVEKSEELTKEELKELVTSGVMSDIEYIEALKDIKVIEHKNAVTGHIYKGNNAELLSDAMKDNNYKESLWLASGQAKKMDKQVKSSASGVLIKVYYEDESGRSFCKLEKIYNVAELEPIQKFENTEKYKNLIEKLRA